MGTSGVAGAGAFTRCIDEGDASGARRRPTSPARTTRPDAGNLRNSPRTGGDRRIRRRSTRPDAARIAEDRGTRIGPRRRGRARTPSRVAEEA